MLLKRPIRTRFRYGFPTRVNLATHRKLAGSFFKRHAVTTHENKTRCATLPRLVGTRFQVLFHSAPAVLFTIPSRYYPLSVTREYLGLAGGPARFTRDFSGPVLLGRSLKQAADVSATGVLPSTPDLSHVLRLHQRFLTRRPAGRPIKKAPTTPHAQPLPGITHIRFSLIRFRSPLLPESRLFSLPAGTEMFHFPAFPPHCLCVQQRVTAHDDCRVSPFGHPRIKARLTAPRGLSRPPTSFIGSWCQGIHRAPLKTWPQMLASTVQFSNNDQPPTTPTRQTSEFTGAGNQKEQPSRPYPQTPNSVPEHPDTLPSRVPRRSSTQRTRSDHRVPNSQRSTHEQPAPDTRRCTGL